MLSEIVIKAEPRVIESKGTLRRLRAAGEVPAVIYGKNGDKLIKINVKSLPKGHTKADLLKIDVAGKQHIVLMREVQVNPLNDQPTHFDFHEVSESDVVKTKVPLEFVGLTREQEKEGSFKILLRSLEVKAPASKIPSTLKVNVSRLKADETAHMEDLEIDAEIKASLNFRATKNLALASLVKL